MWNLGKVGITQEKELKSEGHGFVSNMRHFPMGFMLKTSQNLNALEIVY